MRGLLVVALGFYMFPTARLEYRMKYRPETTCPVSAAQSLRQAVTRSWKPWLLVFGLDIVAWIVSTRTAKMPRSVVVIDEEGRSGPRSVAEPDEEDRENANRSKQLIYLMYCGLYRDPFFAVSLKRTLFAWSEWIPFPPLRYHLMHFFGLQKQLCVVTSA